MLENVFSAGVAHDGTVEAGFELDVARLAGSTAENGDPDIDVAIINIVRSNDGAVTAASHSQPWHAL